jgi:tetratricopeptide (TPR) repeat protein
MDDLLAISYLGTLVAILVVVAWLVLRQILKGRSLESVISKLQPKLQKEKGDPQEYYDLGSVYLRKKLYVKAISEFQKGIKEGGENIPEIYNAIGYAYFVQKQYDMAIKHYKEALELNPEYIFALNNLGHSYEQKNLVPQALEAYEKVLAIAPNNETAKRRANSLRKRVKSV